MTSFRRTGETPRIEPAPPPRRPSAWSRAKSIFADLNRNQQIVVVFASVGLLLLVLFAWFFWPSQYRYDTVYRPLRNTTMRFTIRTHRITGTTYELTRSGWERNSPRELPPPRVEPTPTPAARVKQAVAPATRYSQRNRDWMEEVIRSLPYADPTPRPTRAAWAETETFY